MAKGHMVRRGPFEYKGRVYDRGEVIELANQPNDEKLLRLMFIVEFNGETYTCGVCGSKFTSEQLRTGHGNLRHEHHNMEDEEILTSKLLRDMDRDAPIPFEKTLATMKGN